MRIYTKAGDLAFKTFTFPDGQPHFILDTFELEFTDVTIELAIRNPSDLFTLLLAAQVLRNTGYTSINLDVRYLLGARMDRAIDSTQPFTLEVVARLINGCGFSKVRVLDPHSMVALKLIRNSDFVDPVAAYQQAIKASKAEVVVAPDEGASYRTQTAWNCGRMGTTIIYCTKHRDPQTGKLSEFRVHNYEPEKDGTTCLIIDDICDGGGTFIGLAKELMAAGAKKVHLFVTHGIFSKGLPLEGIDTIYTTDSYQPDVYGFNKVVCIPVSMKEMK